MGGSAEVLLRAEARSARTPGYFSAAPCGGSECKDHGARAGLWPDGSVQRTSLPTRGVVRLEATTSVISCLNQLPRSKKKKKKKKPRGYNPPLKKKKKKKKK